MVLDIQSTFGATGVLRAAALMVGVLQATEMFHRSRQADGEGAGVGARRLHHRCRHQALDQQIPNFLGFPDLVDAAELATGKPVYQFVDIAGMTTGPRGCITSRCSRSSAGLFVAFLVVAGARFKRFPAAIVGIGIDHLRIGRSPLGYSSASAASPRCSPRRACRSSPTRPPARSRGQGRCCPSGSSPPSSRSSRCARSSAWPHEKPHNRASLELFGQSMANIAVGFFSGMPVTGVIARSGGTGTVRAPDRCPRGRRRW